MSGLIQFKQCHNVAAPRIGDIDNQICCDAVVAVDTAVRAAAADTVALSVADVVAIAVVVARAAAAMSTLVVFVVVVVGMLK